MGTFKIMVKSGRKAMFSGNITCTSCKSALGKIPKKYLKKGLTISIKKVK